MNGNFHFLSFCALFLKVQNQVYCEPYCRFNNLVEKMALVGKMCTKSGLFRWHFIVFSAKIQLYV